ncbi:GNAT family N-acetyltransferase [Vibrio gallicus]|uniref:GNAT family N-acetyltransferase n=1 Tax=Vibrio gallicus TaxID=190897 RepID=UPI0021C2DD7E|nr:GNAT family N-acetyltransferase [Vibrio gallicus]
MNKIVFRTCDHNSHYWGSVERLFQSVWPDLLLADTYTPDVQLPPIVVALQGSEVIGGLAYSWFQEPHTNASVIWLNAVFVSPQWRGRGIASELINHGVRQVANSPQSRLYVYTNVAQLYLSLGWSVVDIESEPKHSVMSIAL